MRILIIGGTAFIGPSVARLLHEQGHEVTVFHRGKTEADLPSGVRHIHCGDAQGLVEFIGWQTHFLPLFANEFKTLAPDVVLDMVPIGEQDTQTVMDTFRGIARRVVAISSGDVYRAYGRILGTEPGPPDPIPLTEESPLREKLYPFRGETLRSQDDPLAVRDYYEKILVEHVVMNDADLPGTILRLPAVYGSRDAQHRLFLFLKRMDDNRPSILLDEGTAQWRWTRSYVENVALAVALAVTNERAAGHIYNVGEPKALSMFEWIKAIGEIVGWKGEVVVVAKDLIPSHLKIAEDLSQNWDIDSSRIRTELGYSELVPFKEGLKHTVDWERANPPNEIDPKQFDYAFEDTILAQLGKG